jgi:hypothetical protein
MALTSSIPAFLAALRTGLRAAVASNVFVTIAPVAADDLKPRMIRLQGITEDAPDAIRTIGTRRTIDEAYTLTGQIHWIGEGLYGDDALDAAIAGAFGLYATIQTFLRGTTTGPKVTDTVQRAEVSLSAYRPQLYDVGTGVELEFRIRVVNELVP